MVNPVQLGMGKCQRRQAGLAWSDPEPWQWRQNGRTYKSIDTIHVDLADNQYIDLGWI